VVHRHISVISAKPLLQSLLFFINVDFSGETLIEQSLDLITRQLVSKRHIVLILVAHELTLVRLDHVVLNFDEAADLFRAVDFPKNLLDDRVVSEQRQHRQEQLVLLVHVLPVAETVDDLILVLTIDCFL